MAEHSEITGFTLAIFCQKLFTKNEETESTCFQYFLLSQLHKKSYKEHKNAEDYQWQTYWKKNKGKNLYIENGKIVAITEKDLPCDRQMDAKGLYISPRFIDTHVHGGGNADFLDGGTEPMQQAAKVHLRHGTTAIYPTTLTSSFATLKQTVLDYKALTAQSGKNGLPHFVGMHLEGPYLAPTQAGAQPPAYIILRKKRNTRRSFLWGRDWFENGRLHRNCREQRLFVILW